MSDYQLLACDIDGTLLNKQKEVSEATIRAFERLKQSGRNIVLVSARMPRAMKYLQEELGIEHMPSIAYNGGLITMPDESGQAQSHSTGLPPTLIEEIVERLEGTDVHPGIYGNDEWYVSKIDKMVEKEIFNTKTEPQLKTPREVLSDWHREGRMVHKVMLMGPGEDMKKVYSLITESDLNGFRIYQSKSSLFEITSDETSKDRAVRQVCRQLGLSMDQVVAIGDNDNDLGMIEAAGCGVAMGNAVEELKEAADMVTLPNTEDGVVAAIEKLFF